MPPKKPMQPSIECAKNAAAIAHPGPALVEIVTDPELI